ncbi:hypothetical protein [Marinomonas fungiae]|uniref:Uncharacterized protein n=1 Tax=Marinomonas fungiae TaxID=1137284 RepID=A0A0K6IUU9_9GAMM|nr:hypothetical protein [Marinomonas fungiae]CUB06854.1 hypothetical protein Ga0061065_1244 [Marinomonas fungiae]
MMMQVREKAEDILDLAESCEDFFEAEVVVCIRSKSGQKTDFLRLQLEAPKLDTGKGEQRLEFAQLCDSSAEWF